MPEENQTTNPTAQVATNFGMPSNDAVATSGALGNDAAATSGVPANDTTISSDSSTNDAATTPSVPINLQNLEYSTPSAYIDPDLPVNPTPIDDPNDDSASASAEDESETPEALQTPEQIAEAEKASNAMMTEVAGKIAATRNILIALSSDPTIDELAAAIALATFLDRLGKHAIAIYSGTSPTALDFLNPNQIFEKDADVLQDFVISMNKDKADHLRYKLDGDFVKIFITPYKDKISSDDLNFSYGDYNVDLVLALNVGNGIDLDPALREYGRIMHDATVVNITTGNPGKFGELEWNNKRMSSVSEMVARLLLGASADTAMKPEEATALLAGIVAATDRFSRANTFSATMQTASRLLDLGANQQLVAEHISDDVDNQGLNLIKENKKPADEADMEADISQAFSFKDDHEDTTVQDDATALMISHDEDENDDKDEKDTNNFDDENPDDEKSSDHDKDIDRDREEKDNKNAKENSKNIRSGKNNDSKDELMDKTEKRLEPMGDISEKSTGLRNDTESATKPEKNIEPEKSETSAEPAEDSSLLDELKATEASLSGVGAETAPDLTNQPIPIDNLVPPEQPAQPSIDSTMGGSVATSLNTPEATIVASLNTPEVATATPLNTSETTIAAPQGFNADSPNKYSQMLEDALAESTTPEPAPMNNALPPAETSASAGANTPAETGVSAGVNIPAETTTSIEANPPAGIPNPAASSAPAVENTEINGIPEINYGQTTGDVLPPPPVPPVDIDSPMPIPAPTELPPTSEVAPSISTPTISAPTMPEPNIPSPIIPEPTIPAPNFPSEPITPSAPTISSATTIPASPAPNIPTAPASDNSAFTIPNI